MKRLCAAFLATLVGAVVLPSFAVADQVELGATDTPLIAPTCPPGVTQGQCLIVLTQVTAFESIRDGVTNPTLVKQSGEVVGVTLGISGLSSKKATANADITYLDSRYGSPAEVELTVLRPIGPRALFGWAVAAQSEPVVVLPYLGSVVQLPLLQPLPVVPGEVVGITVPTWAPILSIDLTGPKFAYRQDRSTGCRNSPGGLAQFLIGEQATYSCNYPGTRIEYSATEILAPTPSRPLTSIRKARTARANR